MTEIKVPKTPKKAFNPDRPASDLLKSQVTHLEWAVRHAGERRAGYKVKPVRSEAEAAARMAALLPRLASASNLPFERTPIPDDPAAEGRARATRKTSTSTARTSKSKRAAAAGRAGTARSKRAAAAGRAKPVRKKRTRRSAKRKAR